VSEPGFGDIPLEGEILVGSDAITIDPNFKAARLDFQCVIRYDRTVKSNSRKIMLTTHATICRTKDNEVS
jgi:hypothetical protein